MIIEQSYLRHGLITNKVMSRRSRAEGQSHQLSSGINRWEIPIEFSIAFSLPTNKYLLLNFREVLHLFSLPSLDCTLPLANSHIQLTFLTWAVTWPHTWFRCIITNAEHPPCRLARSWQVNLHFTPFCKHISRTKIYGLSGFWNSLISWALVPFRVGDLGMWTHVTSASVEIQHQARGGVEDNRRENPIVLSQQLVLLPTETYVFTSAEIIWLSIFSGFFRSRWAPHLIHSPAGKIWWSTPSWKSHKALY